MQMRRMIPLIQRHSAPTCSENYACQWNTKAFNMLQMLVTPCCTCTCSILNASVFHWALASVIIYDLPRILTSNSTGRPGFSPIFLLALSPSKHLKHHPNLALSPVVFRKVQFSGPTFYPLHYSTQLSHQSLLDRPSSIR